MNIRKNTSYSSNQVFTLLAENVDILVLLFWLNGKAFLLLSQIYHKHLEWYAYICFKNNSREIFFSKPIILLTNLLAYYVLDKQQRKIQFHLSIACLVHSSLSWKANYMGKTKQWTKNSWESLSSSFSGWVLLYRTTKTKKLLGS